MVNLSKNQQKFVFIIISASGHQWIQMNVCMCVCRVFVVPKSSSIRLYHVWLTSLLNIHKRVHVHEALDTS